MPAAAAIPTSASAARRAGASPSIAQGPARSASGCPSPTATPPIATGRTAGPAPSAPGEVVLEPGLPEGIELVSRRLVADLRVFAPELRAHARGRAVVEGGELLDHPLDAEPLGRRRPVLAGVADPGRALGDPPDQRVAQPVEAGGLHPARESQALVDDGRQPAVRAGGARQHEEHFVAVAGGGEAPRLVAGVLVRAGRD